MKEINGQKSYRVNPFVFYSSFYTTDRIEKFLFQFFFSNSILPVIYKNQNPMNLLRKLTELSPVRFISQRIDISKKELADFFLLALVCFMIIIYKVNKAS